MMWSFEQRSNNIKEFKGGHLHILFRRMGNDSGRQTYIQNKFRKWFGPLFEDSFVSFSKINFKYVKIQHIDRYVNYLLGYKKKNAKEQKAKGVVNDYYRKVHEVELYYTLGEYFENLIKKLKTN